MEVMFFWLVGTGVFGALLMGAVMVAGQRSGRQPWTVFTRRRADRARREAMRPIPTASERMAEQTRLQRFWRPILDVFTGRRRVGRRREATVTPAAPVAPPVADLASAADRQAAGADRARDAVTAKAGDLGSPERGDEVAARRRAAQERIAAAAANRMALSVPMDAAGDIIEIPVDDVPDFVDLPRASGHR